MKCITENSETFIASLALIIALVSAIITYLTFHIQRKHNRKSLRPIINVNPFDYSNCIKIELKNEGVGPAIIKKIVVEKNEHEKKSNVYSWMPTLPIGVSYSNYLTRDEDIPMISNKTIEMFTIRQILRLYASGKGTKFISKSTGIARNTVKKYMYRYVLSGKSLEQIEKMSDAEMSRLFLIHAPIIVPNKRLQELEPLLPSLSAMLKKYMKAK